MNASLPSQLKLAQCRIANLNLQIRAKDALIHEFKSRKIHIVSDGDPHAAEYREAAIDAKRRAQDMRDGGISKEDGQ